MTLTYIHSLMQLIDQHIAGEVTASTKPPHVLRYENTRRHIAAKIRGGSKKYEGLQLGL